MRKLLFATAALAALGCSSASAQPPPSIWNWNGFYVGLNIGYSWGHSDTTGNFYNSGSGALLSTSNSTFPLNGAIGGGQLGLNWQNGVWVLGVEADIQASGQGGSTSFLCPTPGAPSCNSITGGPGFGVAPTASFNQHLDWFGTLRARLGATLTPASLLYVTGGLAYGGISTDGTLAGFTGGGAAVSSNFSNNTTKAGWVIGAGFEWWIAGNWTAKVEYLYLDLGKVIGSGTLPTASVPLLFTYSSHITDNILRVGLNLKL
jgi:outer membrane immunogenic protein